MRRVLGMLFILIVASSLACRFLAAEPASAPSATPQASRTLLAASTSSPPPAATPSPTAIGPLWPSPTASPSPASSPDFELSPASFTVRIHPDGPLYVGDQVSFEIIAPAAANLAHSYATLSADAPGVLASQASFGRFGIQGRPQATFTWAWDTRAATAGDHTLTFSVQPQGVTWTQTVTLLPESDLPWPETTARWASAASECCILHYLTSTPAERDLPILLAQADEQARRAAQSMGIEFTQPITVTLMPRVLGHGGFASDEILVSYLDRNYAGNNFELVLHHEMIHILDQRRGGDYRPSLFQEGLAVYLSGGHFKAEALLPRAAALLRLGDASNNWYLPLQALADDFYPAQHEIGYLEGAALIEYMVNRWGWPAFLAFYGDIHPAPANGPPSLAITIALQAHFGLNFQQLEQDFLAALRQQPPDPALQDDVRLTVSYYDTLRRYQQLLDPSAYYMTAWLLDIRQMRQRGITADLLRHPTALANLTLETLLISANEALRAGRFSEAEMMLQATNAALDAIEQQDAQPYAAHPLAADYAAIAAVVLAQDYRPERISVYGNTARVSATQNGVQIIPLDLTRTGAGWALATLAGWLRPAAKQNGAISLSDSPSIEAMPGFSTRTAEFYTTNNWRLCTRPPAPRR